MAEEFAFVWTPTEYTDRRQTYVVWRELETFSDHEHE